MSKYPDNELFRIEYKMYIKQFNRILRLAKSKYDVEKIVKNISNAKFLWKFINTKLGKNPCKANKN